jgi:hypothetical protein
VNSLRCDNCSYLNSAIDSACKSCGVAIDSAPGAKCDVQFDASREVNAQTLEGGAFYGEQPLNHSGYVPPPLSKRAGVSTAIKILIVLSVVAFISLLAIPQFSRQKRSDFKNLSWADYQSPDGKFSISFPTAPKVSEMTVPTPLGNVQTHIIESEISKSGGCMLVYSDYPAERMSISEEALYDMAVKKVAARPGMMVVGTQRFVTLGGHKGMEVNLKPTDSKAALIGAARMFWVSPRLYIIFVGGPDTAEFKAVHARCFDSFRLSEGH